MVKIAMIGCGAISGIYLKNLTETFREVSLIGVCDLIPERAQAAADFVAEQQKKGCDGPHKNSIGNHRRILHNLLHNFYIFCALFYQ